MGRKTTDFKGSYEEYFKEKGITVRKLPTKNNLEKYRFKIGWSSCNAVFDICGQLKEASKEAVKIFLTVLGDKTLFIDHYNRSHRLNWY